MTFDKNGQGLIDFSKAFGRSDKSDSVRRKRVSAVHAVPAKEVAELEEVRARAGLTYAQISAAMNAGEELAHGGFANRVLSSRQRVSREDFNKIYLAVAKLVFRKILEA